MKKLFHFLSFTVAVRHNLLIESEDVFSTSQNLISLHLALLSNYFVPIVTIAGKDSACVLFFAQVKVDVEGRH